MLFLIPAAPAIFSWFKHDPLVKSYEITYFKILVLGSGPLLINTAISGFFTGRGKTWTVLYANATATVVNIFLDYCLIFGNFGFPAWGIAGAATATVIATVVSAGIFLFLYLRTTHRRTYATLSGARLDFNLMRRLLRYGLPNGAQFMLDIFAFTLFIMFVGRIDKTALTATNMTFQINMLAFMPMIGLGIAVTILVGQALGKNNPLLAQRATWSAFFMTFSYMFLVALGYWLIPDVFLYPFSIKNTNPQEFAQVANLSRKLLMFVAFYCLFDTGNIIFAAALKGAGDTRFVMFVSVVLSWTLMALPCYLAVRYQWGPRGGLYAAWCFTTVYICVLAVAFLLRFLQGKWKSMRVIETAPPTISTAMPELPTTEIDTL